MTYDDYMRNYYAQVMNRLSKDNYPMAQRQFSPAPAPTAQDPDYDMAGYMAKYGSMGTSNGGHYIDEFKLPNHPTFSNQSRYSTGNIQGGNMQELGNNKYMFTPSAYNIQNRGVEGLTNYFQRYENPGTNMRLPNGKVVYGGIHRGLFK